MSLIRCSKCHRNTSDLGYTCIFCGYPTGGETDEQVDAELEAAVLGINKQRISDYGRHVESYVWDV